MTGRPGSSLSSSRVSSRTGKPSYPGSCDRYSTAARRPRKPCWTRPTRASSSRRQRPNWPAARCCCSCPTGRGQRPYAMVVDAVRQVVDDLTVPRRPRHPPADGTRDALVRLVGPDQVPRGSTTNGHPPTRSSRSARSRRTRSEAMSEGRLARDVDVRVNRLSARARRGPHRRPGVPARGGRLLRWQQASTLGLPARTSSTSPTGSAPSSPGYDLGTLGLDTGQGADRQERRRWCPTPRHCLALVVAQRLQGPAPWSRTAVQRQAWAAAADVSAQVHVRYLDRAYPRVLSRGSRDVPGHVDRSQGHVEARAGGRRRW